MPSPLYASPLVRFGAVAVILGGATAAYLLYAAFAERDRRRFDPPDDTPAETVSVEELEAAYLQNWEATIAVFKGKRLRIQGEISSLRPADKEYDPAIIMVKRPGTAGDMRVPSGQVWLKHGDNLSRFSVGQQLVAVGRCDSPALPFVIVGARIESLR